MLHHMGVCGVPQKIDPGECGLEAVNLKILHLNDVAVTQSNSLWMLGSYP